MDIETRIQKPLKIGQGHTSLIVIKIEPEKKMSQNISDFITKYEY